MRNLIRLTLVFLALALALLSPKAEAYSGQDKLLKNYITKHALKHKVERSVLSCVLKIESGYRMGLISETFDYGLAQVNIRTIKAFKLDKDKLLTNLEYNVSTAAFILRTYKKAFAFDEPTNWIARYNIGYQSLTKGSVGASYVMYNAKIQKCIKSEEYL